MKKDYGNTFDYEESLDREKEITRIFTGSHGHNLKTLLLLYRGHYPALAGSVFFFVIKHSPTWVIPVVTANLINAVTGNDPHLARTIAVNTALMILFLLQNIPTNYIHTWLYAKSVRDVERRLREALVVKLQMLSISFHKETQSGRLQSKIMRDVEQIQTLSSQIFLTVLTTMLNIVVSFGVVLTRSPVIFLFYILTMPVAIFLVVVFKGRIKDYNRSFRREMEETSAKVMEMVEMVPVARAHALEKQETRKMGTQLDQIARKGLKLDMVQTYFSSISWVAFQVFQVLCLAFTTWMAYRKVIGIGDITLYQSYFTSIVAQISNLIALLPIISKGLESIDSVGDIICANDVEDTENKKKLDHVRGEIAFRHLSFSYPKNERPVLNDLNLTIHEGETVAFVGASGSGKTTIINLAIGFLKPDSGQVLIDGCNMEEINLQSYRRHIAVVPQQSVLFTGTVRENITYGLEDYPEEKLKEVIQAANLEDMVAKLPEGLDTVLTEHGENLSGGQRQRISLARAFARDPKILILDEATSALDSVSEKKIQDSIHRLVKGRTTLIVAHRLSTIRDADKIAVIGEGGLMEYGSWDELMDKKGAFYRMRTLQE
mgnify:FL=1